MMGASDPSSAYRAYGSRLLSSRRDLQRRSNRRLCTPERQLHHAHESDVKASQSLRRAQQQWRDHIAVYAEEVACLAGAVTPAEHNTTSIAHTAWQADAMMLALIKAAGAIQRHGRGHGTCCKDNLCCSNVEVTFDQIDMR